MKYYCRKKNWARAGGRDSSRGTHRELDGGGAMGGDGGARGGGRGATGGGGGGLRPGQVRAAERRAATESAQGRKESELLRRRRNLRR
jgi:hypothetical protein